MKIQNKYAFRFHLLMALICCALILADLLTKSLAVVYLKNQDPIVINLQQGR